MAQILSGAEAGDARRRAGSASSTGTPGARDRRRGSRESLEMSYDGEEVIIKFKAGGQVFLMYDMLLWWIERPVIAQLPPQRTDNNKWMYVMCWN